MASIMDIMINVKYNDNNINNKTSETVGGFSKLQASLVSIKAAYDLASVAVKFMANSLSECAAEYRKQELADIALDSALKQSGYSVSQFSSKLKSLASQLQQNSAYGDEEIQTVETLLLTYGKTEKEVENLTPFLVDLASKMSMNTNTTVSLKDAYSAYMSAMNGMEKPMRQYGINLDDTIIKSKDTIAITDALRGVVNGAGNDFKNSSQGGLNNFKNMVGELKEAVGAFVKSEAWQNLLWGVTQIVKWLTPDAPAEGYAKITEDLKNLAEQIPSTSDNFTKLKTSISELNAETNPKVMQYFLKELFSQTTYDNVAANAEGIADYKYQISLLNAEIEKLNKTPKQTGDEKNLNSGIIPTTTTTTDTTVSEEEELQKMIDAINEEEQLKLTLRKAWDEIDTQRKLEKQLIDEENARIAAEKEAEIMRVSINLGQLVGTTANAIGEIFSGNISMGDGIKKIFISFLDMIQKALIAIIALKIGIKDLWNPASLGVVIASLVVISGIKAALSAQKFAEGGLITKPTLALMGEAGQNEMVVPEVTFKNWVDKKFGTGSAQNANGQGNVYNITVEASQTFSTIEEQSKSIIKSVSEFIDTRNGLVLS